MYSLLWLASALLVLNGLWLGHATAVWIGLMVAEAALLDVHLWVADWWHMLRCRDCQDAANRL
jgi:hypothetical protein